MENLSPELKTPEFSLERVKRQAQLNASATIAAGFAYLKNREGDSGTAWTNFMGNAFAASWEPIRQQGALAVMELIVLDMLSLGAEVTAYSGDKSQATAQFAGWPQPEVLTALNLSAVELLPFMNIFAILAEHIGVSCASSLTSEGQIQVELNYPG